MQTARIQIRIGVSDRLLDIVALKQKFEDADQPVHFRHIAYYAPNFEVILLIMPLTSKNLWGHISFGTYVHPCMCACICYVF